MTATGAPLLLMIAASVAVVTFPSASTEIGRVVGTVTLKVAASRVTVTGTEAAPVAESTEVPSR